MMGHTCGTTHAGDSNRRTLLQASVAVATVAAIGGRHGSRAHAAALTRAQRDQMTAEQILAVMQEGNERFRTGKETPHNYLAQQAELGHLTGLLAKIRPAVEGTRYAGDRSATNAGFVDAVARTHVELTMAAIRGHSPVLADLEAKGMLKIAGAMYDITTAQVAFFT